MTDSPLAPAAPFVTGSRLDRYIVLECQGRGGMGVVYSAYDPKLDRKVALKLLHDSDVDGRRRERLLREAKALAQLAHPNVIVVFDVGNFGDQLFLAMEFIAGQTLSAWLRQQRPLREMLRVFIEAGRGLAAAHAANVIHRDFKPENVLVGSDGRARVADFGLARRTAEAAADTSGSGPGQAMSATRSGGAVGTPAYMSPEQKAGEPVDARSDQYSFCVTLFEALRGRRPDADARSTEARVPSHVRRALERGLRTSPAERYPNMDALLAQLMTDPRATPLRAGVLGLIVLAVLIVAGALRSQEPHNPPCRDGERQLISVWGESTKRAGRAAFAATQKPFAAAAWTSVENALDRGATGWVSEYTEACEATSVRGEQSAELLDLRMECLDARRQELKAFVQILANADHQVVQQAPQAAESVIDLDQCRRTDALRQLVRPPRDVGARVRVHALRMLLADVSALRGAGKYTEAVAAARNVLTAARELGYTPMVAEAQFLLALSQDIEGERVAALSGLLEATSLADKARDDHLRAKGLAEVVRVLGRLARYDEADGYARLAETAIERAGDQDDLRIRLLRARARVHQGRGHYDDMVKLCKQVVALREQTAEAQPALLADALRVLGDAYRLQGNKEHSLEVSKRALDVSERVLGSAHPITATVLNTVGAAYAEKYQTAEALPYLERALEIREAALGPDHPDVAVSAQNVGLALGNLGQFDRALSLLVRALEIKEKVHGPTHPGVAMAWWSLANLHFQRGDAAAALEPGGRALRIYQQKHGSDHPDVAGSFELLAKVELALGHAASALRFAESAWSIFERRPQMRLELAETRFTLARALGANRRDPVRARKLAILARDVFAAEAEPPRKNLLETENWLRDHGGAAR